MDELFGCHHMCGLPDNHSKNLPKNAFSIKNCVKIIFFARESAFLARQSKTDTFLANTLSHVAAEDQI